MATKKSARQSSAKAVQESPETGLTSSLGTLLERITAHERRIRAVSVYLASRGGKPKPEGSPRKRTYHTIADLIAECNQRMGSAEQAFHKLETKISK
jgi:hypothetical protein